MATDHRRTDARMVQEVLLDDAGFLREIVARVLQEVLEAEMTEHLGAAPHERTNTRMGHRATDTSRGRFVPGWAR